MPNEYPVRVKAHIAAAIMINKIIETHPLFRNMEHSLMRYTVLYPLPLASAKYKRILTFQWGQEG